MTFWCGSGSWSADPCLWLMDPGPRIRIRILLCSSLTFKTQTKTNLKHFFAYYLHKRSHKTVGIESFLTIFAWWYDPDPYLWLMDQDPDPGGPKTCGSGGSGSGGSGSGSETLLPKLSPLYITVTSFMFLSSFINQSASVSFRLPSSPI